MLGIIPYTGNKQELLPVLLNLFPTPGTYKRVVDCFCGGLSVSLNVKGSVISNDYDSTLIRLYRTLKSLPSLASVEALIKEHGLNKTDKDAYLYFRDLYNQNNKDPLWLYVLILHSFSNLNRTDQEGNFNVPFGNRSINKQTFKRFDHFKNNEDRIHFVSGSFLDLDINDDDFVYCDPPYLITEAVYNKFWGEGMEIKLYAWLDELNARGVRFGLSNVTHHAGKQNDILIEWMKKYHVHNLDKKYLLGQHIEGFTQKPTQEVYVCNYENTQVNTNPITIDDFM